MAMLSFNVSVFALICLVHSLAFSTYTGLVLFDFYRMGMYFGELLGLKFMVSATIDNGSWRVLFFSILPTRRKERSY